MCPFKIPITQSGLLCALAARIALLLILLLLIFWLLSHASFKFQGQISYRVGADYHFNVPKFRETINEYSVLKENFQLTEKHLSITESKLSDENVLEVLIRHDNRRLIENIINNLSVQISKKTGAKYLFTRQENHITSEEKIKLFHEIYQQMTSIYRDVTAVGCKEPCVSGGQLLKFRSLISKFDADVRINVSESLGETNFEEVGRRIEKVNVFDFTGHAILLTFLYIHIAWFILFYRKNNKW